VQANLPGPVGDQDPEAEPRAQGHAPARRNERRPPHRPQPPPLRPQPPQAHPRHEQHHERQRALLRGPRPRPRRPARAQPPLRHSHEGGVMFADKGIFMFFSFDKLY